MVARGHWDRVRRLGLYIENKTKQKHLVCTIWVGSGTNRLVARNGGHLESPSQKGGPLCHLAGESWGGNRPVRSGRLLSNLSSCHLSGPLPGPAFSQYRHSTGTQKNLLNLQTRRDRKVARQRNCGKHPLAHMNFTVDQEVI